MEKYGYKLKGVGPISFHLGCDFFRDADGTLCQAPRRYIEKMIKSYESLFGEKPREWSSPLESNDHPELDESEYLDATEANKFQSLVGSMQWVISLGRFDIATATMTLSRYRAMPRKGHLTRAQRVYGYLKRTKHFRIRYRTGLPDWDDTIDDVTYDWAHSVYGNVKEELPQDAPEPLGRSVVLSTFKDANLYHDFTTGRPVTGILHFINGTPIDWTSKRQSTVATATYGSEFVAAKIAVQQIIDLRTTLRYLGVPIKGKSYLFGDNQSVITSATLPHSPLSKRHNALAYHTVREAVAAGIIVLVKVDGKENPADILSKHCGWQQMLPHVKAIFDWKGATRINDIAYLFRQWTGIG